MQGGDPAFFFAISFQVAESEILFEFCFLEILRWVFYVHKAKETRIAVAI